MYNKSPQQNPQIENMCCLAATPGDKLLKALAVGLMLILLSACGAGSNVPDSYSTGNGASGARQPGADTGTQAAPGTGILPQGGGWSANQVNFTVSGDGAFVERFEVTYSGRATNEACDFDYSDLAVVNDLAIEDGLFTYDSGELVIEGSFTAPEEAQITVLWFGYYGGACQVDYNGELTVIATQDEAAPEA